MLKVTSLSFVELVIDPFFGVILRQEFLEFLLSRHKYRFVVPKRIVGIKRNQIDRHIQEYRYKMFAFSDLSRSVAATDAASGTPWCGGSAAEYTPSARFFFQPKQNKGR